MKTVLVAGGAGEVGEGIVRQLLQRGHRVLIQSRRSKKIQELAERLGHPKDLIPIAGDIQTERDMEALLDAIGDTELELDAVVASIGSWWSGPQLVDLDLMTYEHVMHERLTTHFLLAKTFLKELQDKAGSSYLFIHSAAGYTPIPGSGPVSIAGAAQAMLKDVFATELERKAVRVNQLTMMGSIGTRSYPNTDPEGLTNDDVGRYVSYLVESEEVRGQTIKFAHRREMPVSG
jgi:NAD(P)-dependent dehydrogenase (short-subunit alcohol dehydrogenase family)